VSRREKKRGERRRKKETKAERERERLDRFSGKVRGRERKREEERGRERQRELLTWRTQRAIDIFGDISTDRIAGVTAVAECGDILPESIQWDHRHVPIARDDCPVAADVTT
jgi:hypothetical protein